MTAKERFEKIEREQKQHMATCPDCLKTIQDITARFCSTMREYNYLLREAHRRIKR